MGLPQTEHHSQSTVEIDPEGAHGLGPGGFQTIIESKRTFPYL